MPRAAPPSPMRASRLENPLIVEAKAWSRCSGSSDEGADANKQTTERSRINLATPVCIVAALCPQQLYKRCVWNDGTASA